MEHRLSLPTSLFITLSAPVRSSLVAEDLIDTTLGVNAAIGATPSTISST
jgi:hypothetical protein